MTWEELQSVASTLSATNKRTRRNQLKAVLKDMSACKGGTNQLLTIADESMSAFEIWGSITEPAYLTWWLRAVWGRRDNYNYQPLLNVIVRANDAHIPSSNCKAERFKLWREQSCDAIRRTFSWTGVPY